MVTSVSCSLSRYIYFISILYFHCLELLFWSIIWNLWKNISLAAKYFLSDCQKNIEQTRKPLHAERTHFVRLSRNCFNLAFVSLHKMHFFHNLYSGKVRKSLQNLFFHPISLHCIFHQWNLEGKHFVWKQLGKKASPMGFRGGVVISKGVSTSSFDLCEVGRTRQHSFGPEGKNSKHYRRK